MKFFSMEKVEHAIERLGPAAFFSTGPFERSHVDLKVHSNFHNNSKSTAAHQVRGTNMHTRTLLHT